MSDFLSIEEFRSRARADAKFSGSIARLATGEATEVEGKSRTLRFCFSDASIDRAGDSIALDGWDLKPFEKNPVSLWAHQSSMPPIGRASDVGIVGKRLMGDIEFASVDDYPFADTIYRLCKGKFINAVSVGFLPKEWQWSSDKERPYGIDFQKQELLEISPCPVPCNANALAEARAKGIDTGPLRAWAEKLLDEGGGSILVPRSVLEDIFKDAHTPHAARAKYRDLIERRVPATPKQEAEEKTMSWKCSAARDFPIDQESTWDGGAAEKSIFDACGFDGDSPDTERAAKHFLAHDASNPKEKGSYKLPFARIEDGKSKAIAAGIHAASSRLGATDIPDDVKTSAESVIDHYRKEMGEKAWRKATGEDNSPALVANCGMGKDEECGMKDPAKCSIHAPETKTVKAGRKISAKNKALLEEAMQHHDAASKCIKSVLDDDKDDGDDDDAEETPVAEDIDESLSPEQRRLKEARELKESISKI